MKKHIEEINKVDKSIHEIMADLDKQKKTLDRQMIVICTCLAIVFIVVLILIKPTWSTFGL